MALLMRHPVVPTTPSDPASPPSIVLGGLDRTDVVGLIGELTSRRAALAAPSSGGETGLGADTAAARVRDQIDDALRRLIDGRFNACTDCGDPIGLERLRRQPYASRCGACTR